MNLTNSKVSEYSPLAFGGYNSFATVQVEEDNTQRLWMYQMNGKKAPKLIFEKIAPVGYFAIVDLDVLIFVLGQRNTMVLANMNEVDDRIAPAILVVPSGLSLAPKISHLRDTKKMALFSSTA